MTRRNHASILCRVAAALGTALLWPTIASAGANPTDYCAAAKIKTAGKYSMCLLNAESAAIKKALEAPDFSKCDLKLTQSWVKIEDKGGQACPTLGDEIPVAAQVNFDTAVLVAGLLGQTSVGKGRITSEYDVFSIEAATSRTISIDAVDGLGTPVSFTAAADAGSCATVSSDAESITVTAIGEQCVETITLVSETTLSKTLTVKVYDPMTMDIDGGLLIKYVNHYAMITSSGAPNTTFLHPVTEPGWYPLGSLIIDKHCSAYPLTCPADISSHPIFEIIDHPIIVVKQADPTALPPEAPLAAPLDFEMEWNDQGSGSNWPWMGSIWNAVCPDGYKAIGAVVQYLWNKPSTDAMRCVKAGYTIQATIGARLWHDVGSGASRYGSAWEIGEPAEPLPLGKVPLKVGTVMGCGPGNWENYQCNADLARLLLVPWETAEKTNRGSSLPTIDEYGNINEEAALSYAASVRVPFTLIPQLADECALGLDLIKCDQNVDYYPFYRIKRTEGYTNAVNFNGLGNPFLQEDAISETLWSSWEMANTNTFKEEIGISLTAGGDAKFLGSGGSWEVNISTSFGWEQSRTETYAEGRSATITLDVPPFSRVVIARVTTRLYAASEVPGRNLITNGGNKIAEGANWIYLQYPPAL